MKWQTFGIAAGCLMVCVMCATYLASKGIIPAEAIVGTIGTVVGLFGGWLTPAPKGNSDAS
jgi:hypothetical protein